MCVAWHWQCRTAISAMHLCFDKVPHSCAWLWPHLFCFDSQQWSNLRTRHFPWKTTFDPPRVVAVNKWLTCLQSKQQFHHTVTKITCMWRPLFLISSNLTIGYNCFSYSCQHFFDVNFIFGGLQKISLALTWGEQCGTFGLKVHCIVDATCHKVFRTIEPITFDAT